MKQKPCDCCEGTEPLTPAATANRPGLDQLTYRVGTHAAFLETMKARLSNLCLGDETSCKEGKGPYPLQSLTTREADDPAIAALDSWATVADVLTFYQERIANECFLRTAVERRSIQELARLVGYKLRPGVAASTYLAFTVEKDQEVEIPAGTRAQSLPGPGEKPQPFETAEPLKARATWNQLKPRMQRPQRITASDDISAQPIHLQTTKTNLKPNDPILLDFGHAGQKLFYVGAASPDTALKETTVNLLPRQGGGSQENCINFDYEKAKVEKEGEGDRWKIMYGEIEILDFGDNKIEADEALRIIQSYQMNKKCYVGNLENPSLVYFLVNEKAPIGEFEDQDCTHFNPENIEVKKIGGRWKLVEGSDWIRDFDDKEDEARQTFDIIQRYGFEYICYVGPMTYFRRDRKEGEFDYQNARVQLVEGVVDSWKIVADGIEILDFGDNEIEAHEALRVIQSYRMNQQLYVGGPKNPTMQYFLTNGKAPTGKLEGEECIAFNPKNIIVKQIDDQWKIVEGNHWTMDFCNKVDAEDALAVIQQYEFEYICYIGEPDDPSMIYFRRDKDSGVSKLVEELTKRPLPQPSHRYQLPRDMTTAFGKQSDTATRLMTSLSPQLPSTLYSAWAKISPTPSSELKELIVLRVKAAPFGHNAPVEPIQDFEKSVPNSEGITNVAITITYGEWPPLEEHFNEIVLDAEYDQIVPGSWVVIQRLDENEPRYCRATSVQTISRAAYGLSGRVTKLTLDQDWRKSDDDFAVVRSTTVYAQSEPLLLAQEPITDAIGSDHVELNGLYDELEPGRWLIISGERADIPIWDSELVMLAGVDQDFDPHLSGDTLHSTLVLASSLTHTYKRDSVMIHGNVARATHGETRQEVLGSGNGTLARQTFTLKKSPLTYLAAPTASGAQSTLAVRVNDVLWHEASSLVWLEAGERKYITYTDHEDQTTLLFGDGQHGARLSTGIENVKAVYRSGIGRVGNVAAAQISQLAKRPLGVKGVINPLRASGGADREGRDQARRNTPLAVMALDRLLSVQDYADFACAFAGIAKAQATRLPLGRQQAVYLTIAGASDAPIDETSDLYLNLCQALHRQGDPHQIIEVKTRELLLLIISAKVRLLPDYQWETVVPRIRAALLTAFSFERRKLGQDVFLSEAISVMQQIPGIAYVDVDILGGIPEKVTDANGVKRILSPEEIVKRVTQLVEESKTTGRPATRIPVNLTHLQNGVIQPAQLAYLTPVVEDTLILTELS